MTTARRTHAVAERLRRTYGRVSREPSGRPVEGLIATVLSQNTSDVNSGRAFDALMKRFRTPERIAAADAGEIEEAIRVGGLARTKSVRIKKVLGEIRRREGTLSLDRLRTLPTDEALGELMSLEGVGAKTAHCVLLFDLGVPVFPVDTHVLRITTRLGWIDAGTSLEKAHRLLAPRVAPDDALDLHVLLIRHGREVCRPRPRCGICSLENLCGFDGKTKG
jgi:endonuclease III